MKRSFAIAMTVASLATLVGCGQASVPAQSPVATADLVAASALKGAEGAMDMGHAGGYNLALNLVPTKGERTTQTYQKRWAEEDIVLYWVGLMDGGVKRWVRIPPNQPISARYLNLKHGVEYTVIVEAWGRSVNPTTGQLLGGGGQFGYLSLMNGMQCYGFKYTTPSLDAGVVVNGWKPMATFTFQADENRVVNNTKTLTLDIDLDDTSFVGGLRVQPGTVDDGQFTHSGAIGTTAATAQ